MKKITLIVLVLLAVCAGVVLFVGSHPAPKPVVVKVAPVPVPVPESFDTPTEYIGESLVIVQPPLADKFAKVLAKPAGLARKRGQQSSSEALPMAHLQTNMDSDMLVDRVQIARALSRDKLTDKESKDPKFKMNHDANPVVLRKAPEVVTQTNYE